MTTLGYILLFTFLGSIGSLIGGFALLAKEKLALKISHFLASFAAGTLLGTAFFDLLPEAAHEAEETDINVFAITLIGIVVFFLIERAVHWFHYHEAYHEKEEGKKATIPLIIIGDTAHNFLDGVVIAATFLVSIPLGIITTIAVALHEIPQEIGDFGLMIHKGVKRRKIIFINIVTACAAFAGAILMYFLGSLLEEYIPVFLAITAGFFMYIALSDLIPEIHHENRKGFAIIESALLIIGIAIVWIAVTMLHGH